MSSAHSKKSYTCLRGYTVPMLLQWICRLKRSICRPIGQTKFYFDRCSWTQAIKNVSFPSFRFVVLLLRVKLEPPSLFSHNSLVVLHTNHLEHFRFSVLKLSKILVLFGRIEQDRTVNLSSPYDNFRQLFRLHWPSTCHELTCILLVETFSLLHFKVIEFRWWIFAKRGISKHEKDFCSLVLTVPMIVTHHGSCGVVLPVSNTIFMQIWDIDVHLPKVVVKSKEKRGNTFWQCVELLKTILFWKQVAYLWNSRIKISQQM